jgi:hypothetical protein
MHICIYLHLFIINVFVCSSPAAQCINEGFCQLEGENAQMCVVRVVPTSHEPRKASLEGIVLIF